MNVPGAKWKIYSVQNFHGVLFTNLAFYL